MFVRSMLFLPALVLLSIALNPLLYCYYPHCSLSLLLSSMLSTYAPLYFISQAHYVSLPSQDLDILWMYKHLNVVHTLLHRNEELEVQTLIVT
ncbi:hypothetical protein DFH08DRAFT_32719 [Mycena albidolilacea]|uniref:NADH dehydrogenase subunit 4 n=1 Tax=Mycena albidolilacea TaxID=1033008 RepID=A0AAD7AVG2_9AGAR|nr:hypothetical protein DFH08DRAFT_32719 [Mycena albidolilacea]